MRREQLETYTKDASHWGRNNHTILTHFITYIDSCQDPIHVFKYMQEKCICTFMPSYWLKKADFYYEIGEYENCFLCIEEASSRQEEGKADQNSAESSHEADIEVKVREYKDKMKSEMKRFPIKGKRSADEFIVLSNDRGTPRDEKSNQQKLINIYKTKYDPLKSQQKKLTMQAKERLQKSWMFEMYHLSEQKNKQFEEKIAFGSKEYQKCIETPNNRSLCSKMISKAADSVDLLRKRNTVEKSHRQNEKEEVEIKDREESEIDRRFQEPYQVEHVPLTEMKKRVTFDMTLTKMNQVRSNIDRPKNIRLLSISLSNTSDKPKEPQKHFSQT